MTTAYPGAIDNLTNPSASDATTSPSHADQHADANDAIEAIETAIGVKHGARVQAVRSSNQSITTATNTTIQFNAADAFDTDAFHDPSSNNTRCTIPANMGGAYLIIADVSFGASGTGNRIANIMLNSAGIAGLTVPGTASNTQNLNVSAVAILAPTDFVECLVFQSSGGNLNVTAAKLTLIKIA